MSLITLGEAVAWVFTRDVANVKKICEVAPNDRLRTAIAKYLGGVRLESRVRLGGPPITGGQHATAQQALAGLQDAVFMHFVPVWAYGNASQQAIPVPAGELMWLELRVCEEGAASCGLWSPKEERFSFWEPLISFADLERLWPAPSVPANARASQRVLDLLLEATVDGPIKKEEARALAKEKLPGFGARRFEEVWKLLTADRKFRRGQRGLARP